MSLSQSSNQPVTPAAGPRPSIPQRQGGPAAASAAEQAQGTRGLPRSEAPSGIETVPSEVRDSVWDGSAAVASAYSRFIVDRETNQVRVQIRDVHTDEVLREIPPEEMARISTVVRAYLNAAEARRAQARPQPSR